MFSLKKSGIAAVAVAAVAAMLGSFGLAAPAMAADTPNGATTDKGSITISNVQGGATVTAYKVINVNYTNEGTAEAPSYVPATPEYTWDNAVAEWVRGNYSGYIGEKNVVSNEYANLKDDLSGAPDKNGNYSSDIAKFYDGLSNAVGNGTVKLTEARQVTVEGTADANTVTLKDLTVAGYLVKITNKSGNTEGNGNKPGVVADYSYRPVVVTVGFSQEEGEPWKIADADIEAKRSKATIDKSINEQNDDGHNSGKDQTDTGSDTVGIGSIVTYDTRSNVPVFPKDAIEKKYVIADTMDEALTPNYTNGGGHKFIVYGVDDKGTETKIGEGASNDYYTLTTENAEDLDGNAVTWVLDFNYEKVRQFDKIHVQYTATVNEKAIVGEPIYNNVKLQYTNNPYEKDSHRTVPDKVKVYTFGIKVLKQFFENGVLQKDNLPAGAEFAVYKQGGDNELSFVKDDKGYRPAKSGEAGVTSLPVDSKGHLSVYGLDEGTYELEETKAPAGYIKLNGRVSVTITALKDGEDFNGHVEGESELGFVSTTVNNTKGWLPKTGSAGMVLMTVAGVLLVAAGVTVLTRKRRA
ncbi:SpaH/EbpB family LPXTG-anchored major pilin [Bifidobacterium aesculapii]|uniref:SpaH/EbpB family LPXTG-anchored major pilin n=1 Tax=Bifidobacterium aesculapii TaxID=1329411 RepID=UPI0006E14356|nr:SpaH/EbpB family LPXTG-anchored major pilin [Bifidobacterium aesculapii]